MKKYIIVDHDHLKRKKDEIKKKLRYINENARMSLLIPFPAVVYQLNEEKMRYEPILHKYSRAILKFSFDFNTNQPFNMNFSYMRLKYFENDNIFAYADIYVSGKNKKLSKYIKFFSESFRQAFESIVSTIKLFPVHMWISVNIKEKLITVNIDNPFAKINNLSASLSESIKSLFKEYNITIKNIETQDKEEELTIKLYIDSDIYDIEKINEHFSIPYQNVQEIKRRDTDWLRIDMIKHEDYNVFEIVNEKRPIPKMEGKLSEIHIYPYLISFFARFVTEPVDLTLDELDQDFIKAMCL